MCVVCNVSVYVVWVCAVCGCVLVFGWCVWLCALLCAHSQDHGRHTHISVHVGVTLFAHFLMKQVFDVVDVVDV